MEKIKDIWNKYHTKILFVLILLLAIFSRGYRLTSIPYGLHVDEAAMAYDAFSLSINHTDRYLNHLPVYLINFGGGQSALYAYLAAIFIKLFKFNFISIRLPAFLLGIFVIITVYFLTKKEKGEKFALGFMALLTICPWHIMASRFGLDCNLLAPMIIFSIYFLLRAKTYKGYLLSGIFFGITLYTYALSYIIVPIFLLFALAYMFYTNKITFKNIIFLGIPIFLFALPLMLMILINNGYINEIHSFITINKLPEYRGAEIGLSNIIHNFNFIEKMFGNDGLFYNATKEFGTVYKFSVYVAIFGFFIELFDMIHNLKCKKFEIGSIFFILFASVFFCMLIIYDPNINKGNAIFIPIIYFMTVAMDILLKEHKIIFRLLVACFVVYFICFEVFYFKEYPIRYGQQYYFEKEYIDSIKYINSNEKINGKNIHIISSVYYPMYVYTLVAEPLSPVHFNSIIHETNYDKLFSYGKYYFEDYHIYDDALYLVRNNDDFIDELLEAGFKVDNFDSSNSFKILYK